MFTALFMYVMFKPVLHFKFNICKTATWVTDGTKEVHSGGGSGYE